MALTAGLAALLGRYGGGDEATIGTLTLNRDTAELTPLIGNIANTLALRVDLSGRPTFRELVGRVRDVTAGAFEHQDVPFDLLLDALQSERRLDRGPLFDVTMIFLAQDIEGPRLPGLDVAWETVHNATAQLDLTLEAFSRADGISVEATYRTALFEAATIRRLLRRLERVLAFGARWPDRPLHELDLVLDSERPRLRRWGDRTLAPATPAPATLPALLGEQIARDPAALALVDGEQQLTFGAFGERVRRLARLLVEEGVGPEDRVGIAVPRSADALVAIFAVLEAGGAYVPLDPGLPAARLAQIVGEARPALVLCGAAAPPPLGDDVRGAAAGDRRAGDLGAPAPAARGRADRCRPARPAAPRPPGVRHLHVGLDRAAEGRRDAAPRPRQPVRLPPRAAARPGPPPDRSRAAARRSRLAAVVRRILAAAAMAARRPRAAPPAPRDLRRPAPPGGGDRRRRAGLHRADAVAARRDPARARRARRPAAVRPRLRWRAGVG